MATVESVVKFATSALDLAREAMKRRNAPRDGEEKQVAPNPTDAYVAYQQMLHSLAKGRKGRRLLRKVDDSKTNRCLLPLFVFECLPHCRDTKIIEDVLVRMSQWNVREVLKGFHYNCPALPTMLSGLCRNHALRAGPRKETEQSAIRVYHSTLTVSQSLLLAYTKRQESDSPSCPATPAIDEITDVIERLVEGKPESVSCRLSAAQWEVLASVPSALSGLPDYPRQKEDVRLNPEAIQVIGLTIATWGQILDTYNQMWPEELPRQIESTIGFLPSVFIPSDFGDETLRQTVAGFAKTVSGILCDLAGRNVGEYRDLMSKLCERQSPDDGLGRLARFWGLLLKCSKLDAFDFLEDLYRGLFGTVWKVRDGRLRLALPTQDAGTVVGHLCFLIGQCRVLSPDKPDWDRYFRPLVAKYVADLGDAGINAGDPAYRYLRTLLDEMMSGKKAATSKIEEMRSQARNRRHQKGKSGLAGSHAAGDMAND